MQILIRNRHGTIYPERGGFTGVIDLGYDGRGNRVRIKKKGRTKQEVKDRLIRAVDDLDAGIKTSDSYTVGEALRDWLDREPGTSTGKPSKRTESSSTSTSSRRSVR
jgi:hypothetical protein